VRCIVHIVAIGERMFSRPSFAEAEHTGIAVASSVRHGSEHRRKQCGGRVWTANGLEWHLLGRVGGAIEFRHWGRNVRWNVQP
jgi:hypothetical protein